MPDLIDRLTNDIDRRLAELQGELSRLQKARDALTPSGSARKAAPARRRPRAPRSAKPSAPVTRAPRGENRRKILDVIEERPGVSAGEIATVTGVAKAVTYNTLGRLTKDGAVEKVTVGSNAGYRLARRAESEPPGQS